MVVLVLALIGLCKYTPLRKIGRTAI